MRLSWYNWIKWKSPFWAVAPKGQMAYVIGYRWLSNAFATVLSFALFQILFVYLHIDQRAVFNSKKKSCPTCWTSYGVCWGLTGWILPEVVTEYHNGWSKAPLHRRWWVEETTRSIMRCHPANASVSLSTRCWPISQPETRPHHSRFFDESDHMVGYQDLGRRRRDKTIVITSVKFLSRPFFHERTCRCAKLKMDQ